MYLKTEGVVLSRRNFGEADRLLTIYTRDSGKISCIAKGIRRPTSRKSGHLELGNWCKMFIAKGKNLDLLTEVELKKSFGEANFSEKKAAKICHLLELVETLTPSAQKNSQVFDLLVSYLKKIASGDDFNLIASVFKVKLLSALGFFSTANLKDSKTKQFLSLLEQEDFDTLKVKLALSGESHLKLMSFLDSIIESLSEQKLKTSRFVNGS